MNTILLFMAASVLGLVIAAKIPGLEHIVRPAIALVFTGIQAVFDNLFSWCIWLFKILWSAHVELIRNLIFSAEALDPSVEIREAADNGG